MPRLPHPRVPGRRVGRRGSDDGGGVFPLRRRQRSHDGGGGARCAGARAAGKASAIGLFHMWLCGQKYLIFFGKFHQCDRSHSMCCASHSTFGLRRGRRRLTCAGHRGNPSETRHRYTVSDSDWPRGGRLIMLAFPHVIRYTLENFRESFFELFTFHT